MENTWACNPITFNDICRFDPERLRLVSGWFALILVGDRVRLQSNHKDGQKLCKWIGGQTLNWAITGAQKAVYSVQK